MIKAIRLLIPLCISVFLFAITVSAWGDSMGGRPEYTIDQINNGDLGDTITFNSIKDNPMGHEFNFVDTREDTGINLGEDNVWNANDITVEDGKTYIVRMYVHNNNPNGRDAVAKNVHVAFSVPGETGNQVQVNGFITADNATPNEYWDYVNFNSDKPFHLEYIDGSARLGNYGVGNVASEDGRGIAISDDLVYNVNGTKIGYDSVESGEIPGCFEFDNFVTIRVKAVYDLEYTISSYVRRAETKDKWVNELQAEIGDELEYQIVYQNLSNNEQTDVMIRSKLPSNLQYISGTTKLWNANYPEGAVNLDDVIVNTGINIGNYAPTANAYVRFKVKVVDKKLNKGLNDVESIAEVGVNNQIKSDTSKVIIQKTNFFLGWKPKIILFVVALAVIILLVVILAIIILIIRRLLYQKKHESEDE